MRRPVALLVRLEIDHDADVGCGGVLRGREDRIEIELGDFREVADQLRDLHDDVGERLAVDGLAAAHAAQHLGRLDAVEHGERVVAGRGREPEGHVLQHLDEHAAEAERHELAERAVGDRADDDLGAALEHLLDLHAFDLGVGLVLLGVGENGVVGLRDLLCRLEADEHAAGFGLMQNVGGDDLQHHRETHAGGELRGRLGRVRDAFLRDRNAVSVADELSLRRRQRKAALGLHLIENLPHGALPTGPG